MEWWTSLFNSVQQWLFESVIQPVMFQLGMANLLEDGYDATGWLLVGLLQVLVIVVVIGPLERWRPVEAVTDRKAIRIDILYTLIQRLGLFRLVLFFTLTPLFDGLFGALRVEGLRTYNIDAFWPGVTDLPWVSFLLYLAVFDLVDYLIHRGQHRFNWWWALHSLHHSQQQMTKWSDSRNHLLDDVLRDVIIVLVAQLIGVAPGQFVAIVAIAQLSENLHHANARIWFGQLGERLWISPRFHRRHHAVSLVEATMGNPHRPAKSLPRSIELARGCNFGVLLPVWDMLFKTANFELRFDPTGIEDQVVPGADGKVRNYGGGFWSQQWLGILRLVGRG
ncbi:sterol desaturase family protein [Diaphorobacter sp. HDW4A]|uniref:sterol desaturase family protein n=1 Tax=Diaphorobacter sp. HDW4A TaxID=2714924 RepID=UPI00140C0F35|nr:sterol desaturase family protein [Diaphorobacter sp. HDW4A]QIL78877.1 sterol desaturase family protein [Diaphorobacter sp. HDW4A]